MVAIYQETTRKAEPGLSYDVNFVVTAEKAKALKKAVHLKNVKSKKQLAEVVGEKSFAMGMYKKYLEFDKDYECQVSFDVLPSGLEATDTKIDITFDGTSENPFSIQLDILDKSKYSLKKDFAGGTTIANVAEYFVTEMTKWTDFPFSVKPYSPEAAKIELTALTSGPVGGNTPVRVSIQGVGITSSIQIVPGNVAPSADELIAYINSNKIKHKLYVFEDGIDTKNFEKSLEIWQNYNNIDKRGRMLSTVVDSFENLIALGDSKNQTFQSIIGLQKKDNYSQIFMLPCYFTSFIAGVLNFFYTKGTLCFKHAENIPYGSIDNISLPLGDLALYGYEMEPETEWLDDENAKERKILNDHGISTFSTNKNGVLIFDNMVTTYTTDKDGNLDKAFHWMEFDECVSAFLTYMFNRLKRKLAHKRMEEVLTKANFITECSLGYQICSGQKTDEYTKETYHFVRPSGLNTFLSGLKNNTIEDYNDGKLICAAVEAVVYAQLREIMINYKFKN